eukprot:5215607-Pyramimonas_sp.AAC.1
MQLIATDIRCDFTVSHRARATSAPSFSGESFGILFQASRLTRGACWGYGAESCEGEDRSWREQRKCSWQCDAARPPP